MKCPVTLYVSFGKNELVSLQYNRTHTIHLTVSIAQKKQQREIKRLQELLDNIYKEMSKATNRNNKEKLDKIS